MTHLRPTDAEDFEVHGVTFRSFARSDRGSREFAAWEAEFPAGTPGRAHRMTREEVLRVLDGELDVEIDGEAVHARPGDVVVVPAGALFRVGNRGPEPARAWAVTGVGMSAVMDDGVPLAPPWAR